MESKKQNTDSLYYLLGLLFGLLTFAVCGASFLWILGGGILGLTFAALYLNYLVIGRHEYYAAARSSPVLQKLEPAVHFCNYMAGSAYYPVLPFHKNF